MKHIVAFSGGLASAVVAKMVADDHPKDTILLFHDTRTEPLDNDRFRKEFADFLGLPITNDSDGRNIWRLFDDVKFLGNGRNTPCSRILKQERSLAFMKKNDPAILYIGFTCEEWRRAQRTSARYGRHKVKVEFPLIGNNLSKAYCKWRVLKWGIKEPEMYRWADHANCVPCVKGGKAYWGMIYLFERDAWERARQAEKKFGHHILKTGFLDEELDSCLELAKEARKEELIELPCDCAV